MGKSIIIVANNLNSSARTSKCPEIQKGDIIVRFNVGWGTKIGMIVLIMYFSVKVISHI